MTWMFSNRGGGGGGEENVAGCQRVLLNARIYWRLFLYTYICTISCFDNQIEIEGMMH